MTVEILRLTGLRGDGRGQCGPRICWPTITAHPDLSKLLVIDDTVALVSHSWRLRARADLPHGWITCSASRWARGPRTAENSGSQGTSVAARDLQCSG